MLKCYNSHLRDCTRLPQALTRENLRTILCTECERVTGYMKHTDFLLIDCKTGVEIAVNAYMMNSLKKLKACDAVNEMFLRTLNAMNIVHIQAGSRKCYPNLFYILLVNY